VRFSGEIRRLYDSIFADVLRSSRPCLSRPLFPKYLCASAAAAGRSVPTVADSMRRSVLLISGDCYGWLYLRRMKVTFCSLSRSEAATMDASGVY